MLGPFPFQLARKGRLASAPPPPPRTTGWRRRATPSAAAAAALRPPGRGAPRSPAPWPRTQPPRHLRSRQVSPPVPPRSRPPRSRCCCRRAARPPPRPSRVEEIVDTHRPLRPLHAAHEGVPHGILLEPRLPHVAADLQHQVLQRLGRLRRVGIRTISATQGNSFPSFSCCPVIIAIPGPRSAAGGPTSPPSPASRSPAARSSGGGRGRFTHSYMSSARRASQPRVVQTPAPATAARSAAPGPGRSFDPLQHGVDPRGRPVQVGGDPQGLRRPELQVRQQTETSIVVRSASSGREPWKRTATSTGRLLGGLAPAAQRLLDEGLVVARDRHRSREPDPDLPRGAGRPPPSARAGEGGPEIFQPAQPGRRAEATRFQESGAARPTTRSRPAKRDRLLPGERSALPLVLEVVERRRAVGLEHPLIPRRRTPSRRIFRSKARQATESWMRASWPLEAAGADDDVAVGGA